MRDNLHHRFEPIEVASSLIIACSCNYVQRWSHPWSQWKNIMYRATGGLRLNKSLSIPRNMIGLGALLYVRDPMYLCMTTRSTRRLVQWKFPRNSSRHTKCTTQPCRASLSTQLPKQSPESQSYEDSSVAAVSYVWIAGSRCLPGQGPRDEGPCPSHHRHNGKPFT